MRTVIITCGAYGHRPEGKGVRPVYRGQSVVLSDAEAARIVALGAAEYADGAPDAEPARETLDSGDLRGMTLSQLRAAASEMGLDAAGCRKKADYIDLIRSGGEAPVLEAEAPI